MKNVTKILAVLLCAFMVFSLAACGGDEDTESKNTKDTPTVSDTTSGDNNTEIAGGYIVLPEDGKIEFGKDNKKNDESTDTDSGNTSSETAKPEDTTKPTESETTKPTESETTKPTDGGSSTSGNPGDDGSWGGVNWNN